jgi:preprotein translocase subunit SecD
MFKKALITTIIIFLVAALGLLVIWPIAFKIKQRDKFNLGLDLQGGAQITYEADLSKVDVKDQDQAITGVINVIRNRIDAIGVSEPIIQSTKIGDRRGIIVELPGVSDVNQAIDLIGKTAQLDFRTQAKKGEFIKTDLTGADLKKAAVQFDQSGNPEITLKFNSDGAKKFAKITKENIGKPVAIYLDETPISIPTVQSEIRNGDAVITGQFSITEAKKLAIQLNAGALPVPISIAEQRNVGATLGTDSIQKSLLAGLIGIVLVSLFMIIYYRLPGVLATLALAIYAIATLAVFKLIPVTLTLAGIAGFILSVGMAVDANILIFERLKEELREGKTLTAAVEAGFSRAWNSIRDSNVSSIITALILFIFGAGVVKGFAVTLSIGVLISMFTAIIVTRTFLRLVMGIGFFNKKSWFGVPASQIKEIE